MSRNDEKTYEPRLGDTVQVKTVGRGGVTHIRTGVVVMVGSFGTGDEQWVDEATKAEVYATRGRRRSFKHSSGGCVVRVSLGTTSAGIERLPIWLAPRSSAFLKK